VQRVTIAKDYGDSLKMRSYDRSEELYIIEAALTVSEWLVSPRAVASCAYGNCPTKAGDIPNEASLGIPALAIFS
jgi:hypothetical protein